MRRICIGTCILLLLLAVCVLFSWLIPQTHMAISDQLEQASRFARHADWQQATQLAEQAFDAWQRAYALTTMVADHEPSEEIDALFAQLEIYTAQHEITNFAATALQLSRLIAAIGNNHNFKLWNLL